VGLVARGAGSEAGQLQLRGGANAAAFKTRGMELGKAPVKRA